MDNFEYRVTHKGLGNEEFIAADYMVNCDGRIIAFKLSTRGFWQDASPTEHPFQVFPKVDSLEIVNED